MATIVSELATKWIAYENNLINVIKANIRKTYKDENIPEGIKNLLNENDRDKFFTKYLSYAYKNAPVKVSVTGNKRRRLNVSVDGKKLEVPQHIWNEINSYEPALTLEDNKDELMGYAWEVAGEYIVDNSLKQISKELNLDSGIKKVQPLDGFKKNISVDYVYDVIEEVDRSNLRVRKLNIDTKANLYNFHIGDISLNEFNEILATNFSEEYKTLVDYLKVHILNKKYGNQDVIFYSPSGDKRATTLGTVLSDVGGFHFKNQMSNNDIIKMATDIYMNNREYYEEIGESGYNFILFMLEGANQKYSSELEEEVVKKACEVANRKIAASLWYSRR